MKQKFAAAQALFFTSALLLTGCFDSILWKEAIQSGLRASGELVGHKAAESRLVSNEWEFYGSGEGSEEYIPVQDSDLRVGTPSFRPRELNQAQGALPKTANGTPPLFSDFKSPTGPLAGLFKNLRFDTDEHQFRDQESFDTIKKAAAYLKRHPNVYLFVLGHCDERASEAYNLALGTRRAGFVRQLLIKEGIDPSRLFTISFGKERPADHRHVKDAWAKNRRVEFKIYEMQGSV